MIGTWLFPIPEPSPWTQLFEVLWSDPACITRHFAAGNRAATRSGGHHCMNIPLPQGWPFVLECHSFQLYGAMPSVGVPSPTWSQSETDSELFREDAVVQSCQWYCCQSIAVCLRSVPWKRRCICCQVRSHLYCRRTTMERVTISQVQNLLARRNGIGIWGAEAERRHLAAAKYSCSLFRYRVGRRA